MNEFVIKHKLPSLNEVISANRYNRYAGAKFKKDIEEVISWAINQALTTGALKKVSSPIVVKFEWHERTKRRDADNIASSKKFILDAMVRNGIIKDDSRKYVKGFYDTIIDDIEDFVKVELIEI